MLAIFEELRIYAVSFHELLIMESDLSNATIGSQLAKGPTSFEIF